MMQHIVLGSPIRGEHKALEELNRRIFEEILEKKGQKVTKCTIAHTKKRPKWSKNRFDLPKMMRGKG